MAEYLGWETAVSLLDAYVTLAVDHEKTLRTAPIMDGQKEPHPYYKYKNSFALLILNASIIEGTMRTILSEQVNSELKAAIERGRRQGRTEHDGPTRLLAEFLINVEGNGSWNNLTANAISYLGEKMDKSVDPETLNGVGNLFILRNVLAHGTALIQPKMKMSEDMKDIYPYKWQSKLHGVAMYLDKQFNRGSVFNNLAHPDCAKHFMEVTKQYFTQIEKSMAPLPDRAAETINKIKRYHFGGRLT